MNKLSLEQRAQMVRLLVEGNGINAITRISGVAKNTVLKLLSDVGAACQHYHTWNVRRLPCERIQCDEIWSFCRAKQKNVPQELRGQFGFGDVWVWTSICADTKIVPCWLVGPRDGYTAYLFLSDLASRLANRPIQLTTDGFRPYLSAVAEAFKSNVDYAMLVKMFAEKPAEEARYSPPVCTGAKKERISGYPDPDHISTSYAERQNLTMRMSMRRFTRLTNGFSKKVQNHKHAVALHYMFYNYARPHMSLQKRTPAQAAGIADHVWTVEEIVRLAEPDYSALVPTPDAN